MKNSRRRDSLRDCQLNLNSISKIIIITITSSSSLILSITKDYETTKLIWSIKTILEASNVDPLSQKIKWSYFWINSQMKMEFKVYSKILNKIKSMKKIRINMEARLKRKMMIIMMMKIMIVDREIHLINSTTVEEEDRQLYQQLLIEKRVVF